MALSNGSEWHRWDVHIHTPGTALNDQFKCTIDDFIRAIKEKSKEKDIIALGITDYYSIDNYEKIKKKVDLDNFGNIKLIFPNIEFRLGIRTEKSEAINIHLLISPDDPEHIYHINQNLQRLTYEYQGTPYSCTREQITRLGSILDRTISDEFKKYEVGLNNFRPEFKEFIKWYEGDIWLKENALIAISGKSKDGISSLTFDGGFKALRKEITSKVQIMFTSNEKDRINYLGENEEQERTIISEYNSLKPCLIGSDAHSIKDLFESEKKRYCWIKAEPTFEGFKQILYEPKERVFIGEFPPNVNRNVFLSRIRVPDTDWFPTINIPINKGLVSIIGPRGSGKTALLDIISISLEAYESSDAGFIAKAQNLALPLKVYGEINNAGRMKIISFNNEDDKSNPKARYLSQQFVEKLCSSEGASIKLVEEIEKFIFSELDDYKKQGANNFTELKERIVLFYDNEIQRLSNEIEECSNEITRIHTLRSTVKSKRNDIDKLNKDILSIKLPEITNDAKASIVKKQELYNKKYQSLNSELISLQDKENNLRNIKGKIIKYNDELQEKGNDLIEELSQFNLTNEDKSLFYISFPQKLIDWFNNKINIFHKKFLEISGNKENPEKDTYFWYKNELEKIKISLENLSKDERKNIELNNQIQEKKLKIKNIEKQIEEINNLNIEYYQQKRIEKYKRIFELTEEKCKALSELYGPLENNLKTKYDEVLPLSLYVKRSINLKSWVDSGNKIISYSFSTKLKNEGGLEKVAKKILLEIWKTGKPQEVCDAMKHFIEEYISSDISKLLREHYTPNNLAQWLFSTNHITTPYEIKYEDVSIEKLSPGTRGVVLMLLFLKVDINDRRPLLIDQPEDNLDPASVYKKLVPYFKEARERRQIIMVTHNPNLVVGTDSDQIIIANSVNRTDNQLPEFSYISGGLENPEIKTKVCEILEGGELAFNKRAKRYFKPTG
uniref:ATPase AAA-type core domain-containing protein n=1 Tax=uncultured bacterium contig00013 TaxID=1181504 RepID=A0A806K0R9_9BACT|nr:hypothetical protein [uncultured bacterium contig00013]